MDFLVLFPRLSRVAGHLGESPVILSAPFFHKGIPTVQRPNQDRLQQTSISDCRPGDPDISEGHKPLSSLLGLVLLQAGLGNY